MKYDEDRIYRIAPATDKIENNRTEDRFGSFRKKNDSSSICWENRENKASKSTDVIQKLHLKGVTGDGGVDRLLTNPKTGRSNEIGEPKEEIMKAYLRRRALMFREDQNDQKEEVEVTDIQPL